MYAHSSSPPTLSYPDGYWSTRYTRLCPTWPNAKYTRQNLKIPAQALHVHVHVPSVCGRPLLWTSPHIINRPFSFPTVRGGARGGAS